MLQKIRKNKFFRKTLVFASVFLILATSLVFPVLAQAPSVSNVDSNRIGSVEFYFSSPPDVGSSNTLVFGFISNHNTGGYIPLFFEGFFNVYGFSISDSPSTIFNAIYNDYVNNGGNYTYPCYNIFDDSTTSRSVFDSFASAGYYDIDSFSSMWNNYFDWEIAEYNQVNSLTQQNTTLNNQITAKDEEIAFKQQQIDSANRQYQILSNQYNDLTNSYNTLQSNYDTLQTNNYALQSNYDTLQSNYNTLNNDYNSLQGLYNNLEAENEDLLMAWSELYDKYLVAESEGYTRALNDYNAFKKGLFDIFNAPFVFVQNLTGFEIFGITIFDIFAFFILLFLCIFVFLIIRKVIF